MVGDGIRWFCDGWTSALLLLVLCVVGPAGALAAVLVSDINVQPASSRPGSFVHLGAQSLFIASTPDAGAELWVFEPDSERIERLTDIRPGRSESCSCVISADRGSYRSSSIRRDTAAAWFS